MATISVIAAMANNRVIGRDNALPWHLPADLQHFKQITMGKPMVMGRKTWESLPGILPGRPHIVITRNPDYKAEGATVAHSLEEAINAAGEVDEIMIIGGANLYAQALKIADRLYLTLVDSDVEGDASFPLFDPHEWNESDRESHPADEKNAHAFSFVTFNRNPS